ncbi:FAD-binding oxidoreductase [Roseobacter denitrificans]|uniref:Oxidoreductase, FAD-binding, putative n=1 Tax=Roseobacter denitrificans (strain ATCC 33942 / OCh 114) TaxID=375451 RepID=Q16BK7_ROSDO|nr:FAD-binding oxidoreductase [Roseobacter denitrificans]ABG30636.1 oxidoreductase, FAD-binding, putative [Roseobacter denitrificans OCh 114]AVL53770.1 FAD-binding oxidoreductase [Roseobacter denitrificans]SFG19157.1 glycine oxidase [Roseobacter denitrificans OCh 114]
MIDITIRGAGILGLSIAWVCVQRGAQVRIVDPFGAGAGSSGGVVGALAPHVPENWNPKKAFQLDSLLMAQGFWSDVADASGKNPGYIRSGRLQPIADEHALTLAHRRCDTAKELWGAHAKWRVEPATPTEWSPPSPTGWLIRDNLSALIHPRLATNALAAALKSRGVSIETDAADHGQTVWATGVHGLQMLSAAHHRSVGNGVKGQAAVFDHDAAGQPQLFIDGLHIVPHANGTVAIGSTSEREYTTPDQTDTQLDALIEKARAVFPTLKTARVIERWAGVRPRSRSRAPMLGAWPGRDGHFIANGGFKIGFGMAPKIAHVMADLLLEGKDTIPEGFEVSASF